MTAPFIGIILLTLQTNFLRHFWWEQEQVFSMGLAEHKEPCDIVTSNAGQCLWTVLFLMYRGTQGHPSLNVCGHVQWVGHSHALNTGQALQSNELSQWFGLAT